MSKTKMRDGVIKRGKTYSYVIPVKNEATGRTKQVWKGGFASRDEAVAERDRQRVAARSGTHVARRRLAMSEYLREWVGQIDVKPKTRDGYRYNIEHYAIPRIGAIEVQELRPQHLTRLYADLRESGGRAHGELGWRSIQSIHRTISSALRAATFTQIIPANPAERAVLPPRPRATTRREQLAEAQSVFSPGQVRTFLDEANKHRLGALFHLAVYTGARRGELLHLRWEDIDLESRRLRILGTRSVADGKVCEGSPKGGRSRVISLDEATITRLRTHRADQAKEKLRAGELWSDDGDYVFRTARGLPISLDTPSQLMPRLCQRASLPRIRFHDLRHTHATILLSENHPLHEVADRLGHADATITLKVYAKVLQERSQGLGDAFAAALASPAAASGGGVNAPPVANR